MRSISAAASERRARARGARQAAARDDEPPRPHRRRDRYGQDEDPAGLAEQLSAAGVPVFVADVKGDVSGLADRGAPIRRARRSSAPPTSGSRTSRPASRPSSSRSAASAPACPCAPPSLDFGPQLLAKVLGANETQEQSLGLSSAMRRQEAPAARPLGSARRADLYLLRRRQRRARRASAGCPSRLSASCCARSSGSRTAAATRSSASQRSRSTIC